MMLSRERKNQSNNDNNQFEAIRKLFLEESLDVMERIDAFPKYCTRQSMAKFLTKYELFNKILDVNGSIVECGVLHGGGLMAWAKLSSILEPANHTRKIIGFDTFEGFPEIHDKDSLTGTSSHFKPGGLAGASFDSIEQSVKVYDMNRPIQHIPKVELVKGDITLTAEEYLKNNQHLVVSLLYLDLDLYEPTKKALEVFLPRMPKGSIICFDELNAKIFPGETLAVEEVLGIKNLSIKRFTFDSYVSYAIL